MAYVEKKITVEVNEANIIDILTEYVSGDPETLSELLVKMTNDESLRDYVFSVEFDDAMQNIYFVSDNN